MIPVTVDPELSYASVSGRLLTFRNPKGLYPVNQYQSLVLTATSELAALLLAARGRRRLAQLSAWEPCCGGGPAAVALKTLGVGHVQATDVNADALGACKANAEANGVVLDRVARGDMLDDGGDRAFDLIACNPPCGVGDSSVDTDSPALRAAVAGGPDGMDPTYRLLSHARSRLSEAGSLLFVVVSTGHVAELRGWLDALFPGKWRTFPTTPVAAPYAQPGDRKWAALANATPTFEPFVWRRPDGWFWRLTWIVEATLATSFLPDANGPERLREGFALSPYGYEVARDPALEELVRRRGSGGYLL